VRWHTQTASLLLARRFTTRTRAGSARALKTAAVASACSVDILGWPIGAQVAAGDRSRSSSSIVVTVVAPPSNSREDHPSKNVDEGTTSIEERR
jgi:hypothetical protein